MMHPEPGDMWRWQITGDVYVIIEQKDTFHDGSGVEHTYSCLCLTTGGLDEIVFNQYNTINWELAA